MSSEVLSDVSKNSFTKNVVIIVPPKLYEAYKSYFKDINKVEVPTEEWQDYMLSQIEAAMQTIKMISDTDKNTIASYISTIENAMTLDDMATAYYAALTLIDQKKTIEENLKDLLGSMGRMQSGPAIEIVGNDGRVILIYDIKKVKYIMVNKEE